MIKKIEVVAAAIISQCGQRLFIAKRASQAHQGGLWEFPGGKKEHDETAEQALSRELEEEIGIKIKTTTPLIKLEHDYGDKLIELDVYRVTEFSGEAHGAEGQETKWIDLSAIDGYDFPEANIPIIRALKQAQ
ncbi:8-oxo-dGTP diphosphatase MutT [Pseudomonas sp. HK3]|jgi:8-oxo-dGTP diphosphatase